MKYILAKFNEKGKLLSTTDYETSRIPQQGERIVIADNNSSPEYWNVDEITEYIQFDKKESRTIVVATKDPNFENNPLSKEVLRDYQTRLSR